MTTVQPLPPKCFLGCRADARVVLALSKQDILTGWRLERVTLSDEDLGNFIEIDEVYLYRCQKCGFEFFDPALAGGSSFYAALHAQLPGYYAPARPENERNARFAQRHGLRSILDIGCGTGFALDAARERGLETYGIELSASAATAARSRGHTVFSALLEELDPRWHNRFDLISLNQVLEHVGNPVELIRSCMAFLSPGGVIVIAVPSSEGVLRLNPWAPASWPPHHVSHWRKRDLYTLSRRCGLEIIKAGGNQLLGSELETNLFMNRELCLALGKTHAGLSPRLIKLLAFVYRKSGMKFLFRSHGHSIFCFARRSREHSLNQSSSGHTPR